jgi:hypothetical protein
MDQNLRYGGEAFFFISLAVRLATWVFRASREVQGDPLVSGRPIGADQYARMIAMINHPVTDGIPTAPPEAGHYCPKCGTQIHTDIVHGGLLPCRKCGWTAGAAPSS